MGSGKYAFRFHAAGADPKPRVYHTHVSDSSCRRRKILLFAPAALLAPLAGRVTAQIPGAPPGADAQQPDEKPDEVRLPNGRNQQNEIAKANYQKNVKDAQELSDLARSFEEDLKKGDQFVLSLSNLKKLDDIEKITRRIRGRMKRY